MKQAIVGFGFLLIVILTVAIVMALGRENTELNSLTQSVELAIYQSLEEAVVQRKDPGELFEVNLDKILGGESIEIIILESDLERGILSVTVLKHYENFREERVLSVTRTVIYERDSD